MEKFNDMCTKKYDYVQGNQPLTNVHQPETTDSNVSGCNYLRFLVNSAGDEDGGALLMVLFFLSMSFALVLGFAYSVRSDRHTSTSGLFRKQSQLLADSAMNQAIGVLRSTYDPTDGIDDDHDLYPATVPDKNFYRPPSGSFRGRYYWCTTSSDNSGIGGALAVSMGGYDFVPNAMLDITAPMSPVKEDRGFIPVVTDGVLIGRIAFMIIDESGKLDPNAITMWDASELSGVTVRTGQSVSEISLQDADIENFNSYILSENKRWFSTRHLARSLELSDFEDQVVQVLHPFSRDQEQYWNDDDNNGVLEADEIYSRLDVTSADDMSLAQLYKTFVAANDSSTDLPDIGDLNDDNDCAWLKKLHEDDIISDSTERRLVAAQVAVNVVDYVDSDDEATIAWITDTGKLSVTNPGADNTAFTVYGRENQFGISELSAKVITSVSGSGTIRNLEIGTYFKGEIYFPESESYSLGTHQLTVTYSLTVQSALGATQTFFNNTSLQVNLDATTNESGGTLWYSSDWNLAGYYAAADFLQEGETSQFQITNFQIDNCVLNNGTHDIDIFPSQSSHEYWWNWQSSENLTGTNFLYATLEAYDPLNNSQDENGPLNGFHNLWKVSPADSTMSVNTDAVGIGQLTLLDSGGGSSLSEYGDIQVKNGPLERIGEIGQVGSYWPGRSIRLWAAEAGDEIGADTYLLDLFKVGDKEEVKGRVNINTMNADVLTALLTNTTTIPVSDAVMAILDKRSAVTFTNIGDLFSIPDITGSNKTQDKYEEEMVTKITELITVRQNYFTVIVAAQSVRDNGSQTLYLDLNGDGDSNDEGEMIEGNAGEFDQGIDEILSTTKLIAVVFRDAFTNQFTIEHIEYLK